MESNDNKQIDEKVIDRFIEQTRQSYSQMLKMYLQLYKKHELLKHNNFSEKSKISWDIVSQFIPQDLEKNLKEEYPVLNQNEVRLCCLLFFDLSYKNILEILPYSSKSLGSIIVRLLNTGIIASEGKYIALHESDGIMHIDRLKLQYSIMEEYPEISICSSWETVFGKRIPNRIIEQKLLGFIELPLVQMLIDNLTVNSNYTIRSSFISERNLFYKDCNQAEDYIFWAGAAKMNSGFYIDSQPLVFKRISDTSISRKHRLEKIESISKIKRDILRFLCEKYYKTCPVLTDIYNSYYKLLNQKLVGYMVVV